MSTAYQVKRADPLAINNIEVTFEGDLDKRTQLADALDSLKTDNHDGDGLNATDVDDPNDDNLEDEILDNENLNEDDLDDDSELGESEDEEDGYVKTISVTITACEMASGKRITLGHMTADLLEVSRILPNEERLLEICHEHDKSLAMLYRAFFTEEEIYHGNLPEDYIDGDILMIDSVRLKPEFRGYGVGLLAVDKLLEYVARVSRRWREEGLVVLEPTGLNRDLAPDYSHEAIQRKLVRHWQMLGLKVLARERRKHCTFLGQWMGYKRPKIDVIVPHLLS